MQWQSIQHCVRFFQTSVVNGSNLANIWNLNDSTCFVPSFGEVTNLVLDVNMIPYLKGRESLCMLGPSFMGMHVAVLKGYLVGCQCFLQVVCGWYLPGKIGMKSLMGLPKTIIAGDNVVAGSGVFLYWRIAHCTASRSTSSPPLGPVLLVRIRFMILTPSSALQLLCGKATDDS